MDSAEESLKITPHKGRTGFMQRKAKSYVSNSSMLSKLRYKQERKLRGRGRQTTDLDLTFCLLPMAGSLQLF